MKFGTDEFFQYLKDNFTEENDASFSSEISSVIEAGARAVLFVKGYRVSKHLSKEDIDEIVQDVLFNVWIKLPAFINDSADLSKSERNKWLAQIAVCRAIDRLRKNYSREERIDALLEDAEAKLTLLSRKKTDFDDMLIEAENNESALIIYHTLKCIFEKTTTPERMLSYLFNKFVVMFSDTNRSNGSPEEVANYLNGKTVGFVAEEMKRIIRNTIGHEIPGDVFAAFDEKLKAEKNGVKNSEQIFELTASRVSDITYRVSQKIEKNKDLIPGAHVYDNEGKEKKK
jgi:hypothetical protein